MQAKNENSQIKIEMAEFLKNTKLGEEFEITASKTGSVDEDGAVFFNDQGVCYLGFDSVQEFADHFFLNLPVVHYASYHVADHTENGIKFLNESYPEDKLILNDGDAIFTIPSLFAKIDPDLLKKINSFSLRELINLMLNDPELAKCPITNSLIKKRTEALTYKELLIN